MKSRNHYRGIMFLILFSGLGVIALGTLLVPVAWLRYVIWGVGIALCVYSTVYGVKRVRCPHCHALLSLKLTHTVRCPYCHEYVD